MGENSLHRMTTPQPLTSAPRVGNLRWIVVALLFFSTTLSYVDRQIIAVLKGPLQESFGWNEIDYSKLVTAFQFSYAIGYVVMGRFLDWVGVRAGLILAVAVWSAAAAAHGLISYIPRDTALSQAALIVRFGGLPLCAFIVARLALGIAEGANFPAAIRAVAEWFPKRQRALATGVFNAGSNVGALLTPLVIPFLAIRFGWAFAFYFSGALGFLFVIAWAVFYRSPETHPSMTAGELALITSDRELPTPRYPWLALLGVREVQALCVARIFTEPSWTLYLFWGADFFSKRFHLDLKTFGIPLAIVYLMADFGSVGGGWLSSWLMSRGWSLNAARKTTMLVCALCVVPIAAAPFVPDVWMAVGLMGLAAAAHQGWSANLYTLGSDTMPKNTTSSVTGIMGTAGALSAMVFSQFNGYILQVTHGSYVILFAIGSLSYLAALGIVQLMVRRIEPVQLGGPVTVSGS
jgi:ACS family hexuronate transporter-like MFS transporter